ncbi:MAG: redox-sensing transcriptional repressor Rex [bacterium]
MIFKQAPEPTIGRLAIYLRALRTILDSGVSTVSSADIEKITGINSGQVRKDLSYFGEFGRPGRGYSVEPLVNKLAGILGLHEKQKVMIVGAGNLGTALVGYTGFSNSDFELAAIYDNNFNKIGRSLWHLEILDIENMPSINREMNVNVGIITTPGTAAQYAADKMFESGVKVIMNFAPARINVPENVTVRNVDLTQELQILCYYMPKEEIVEIK